MLTRTLAFSFLLSQLLAANADDNACRLRQGSDTFDLTPLKADKDYEIPYGVNRKILLNVCRNAVSETWGLQDSKTIAGFFRADHSDFSIGEVNTTLHVVDGSPYLYFTGGSKCPGAQADAMKASTAIRFICDTGASQGTPKLVANLPPKDNEACAFFFEWRTEAACPISGGWFGTFVTVLASIAFAGLLAYIAALTYYNHFVLGLRGLEQFPRISICSFSDTRDFFYSIWARIQRERAYGFGSGGRNFSSNGYNALSSEEEEAMVGPRFSLESDDDEEVYQVESAGKGSTQPSRERELPPLPRGAGDQKGTGALDEGLLPA
jgi:cation-dependent mannose-6-phosphate receptor